MTPLVRVLVWLRRTTRAAAPALWGVALALAVALSSASKAWGATAYGLLALSSVVAVAGLADRRANDKSKPARDMRIGLLLVSTALGLAHRLEGSLDGALHSLVYVAIGVVSALARPGVAVTSALAAVGLEVTMRAIDGSPIAPTSLALHGLLGLVFALLHTLVLREEVSRVEGVSRRYVQREVERQREAARSYRLLSHGEGTARDQERLARSGVEEIHRSMLYALTLLRESLGAHTALLLWKNEPGTHLRVSELATESDAVADGPFLASDGLFAAVLTREEPVQLSEVQSQRLAYYVGPAPVKSVLAVPVMEEGYSRGVLVVDRLDRREFTEREEGLVTEAAAYALRAVHNERVFVQLERARGEQGKLYRAAEALGRVTTEQEVIAAAVQSAREIASLDFAAVTLFDEPSAKHEIRAASGDGCDALVGKSFQSPTCLVQMALDNRHPLPFRGEYDERRQVVFTKQVAPPSMPSILVLPMLVHDRPLGTLVLGSRKRHAFGDSVRSTLDVLSRHVAVSLSNARMVRRLEELATTDGLTGLYNKRALLELAEAKLRAARRFSRQLAVLVTDIDHFKKVNDTHGHDVGDVVIKGLGDVLRRAKRTIDAVARFGGEEFVVLCEETDSRGAHLLAERVREELGRTVFRTPAGDEVRVTCSIGVATFPDSGETWAELFKAADEALYHSKRSGRNRTTVWTPKLTPAAIAPAA
jgi:two-component system cell cycle response regulator